MFKTKVVGKLTLLIIVGMLILGGCAKKESKVIKKPFKMAIVTWVGFGPFYIAQNKGFFKEEGIDVELVRIEDFGARRGALASGTLQGSVETVDSLAIGIAEGLPAIEVLKVDESCGGDGIVVKKEIKSIKDLKGKTVAFSKGSPSHFFLLYLMKKEGLTSKDITPQYMEAGDAGAAFIAGKVDAAITWEPWLTKANESEHGRVLLTSKESPDLIADIFVIHKDTAKTRREDVKKLLRAWFKALKFLEENKDESIEIMGKNLGLAKEELEGMLMGIKFPTYQENLDYFGVGGKKNVFVEMFNAAADVWKEEGLIEKYVPDGKEVYDSSFLDELYK